MQKRTFLTDATPVSIDLPVQGIGVIIINATDKDCVVTADNGDTFPCPALVISTWSLPPTLHLRAALAAAPTNSKACNVIFTDEPTLNSTSQLATLSTGGGSVPITYSVNPPASPNDGDLWALPVDGAGTVWLFRYNAASVSLYKWEFVGGSDFVTETTATDATNAAAYTTLANDPNVTLPRDGDYNVFTNATVTNSVFVNDSWIASSFKIGAAAAVDANAILDFASLGASGIHGLAASGARRQKLLAQVNGTVLQMQQKVSAGSTINVFNRRIAVIPIRVR